MAEPDADDLERAAAFVRERLTPGSNWTLELARLIAEVREGANRIARREPRQQAYPCFAAGCSCWR